MSETECMHVKINKNIEYTVSKWDRFQECKVGIMSEKSMLIHHISRIKEKTTHHLSRGRQSI